MAVKQPGFVHQDTPRRTRAAASPKQPGYVYVLHFRSALVGGRKYSRHYIGWAKNWIWRVQAHRRGTSRARIMEVAFERGIAFDVALVIRGDRQLERRLKRAHHHARYCPFCGARRLADYRIQGAATSARALSEEPAPDGKLWGVDYA